MDKRQTKVSYFGFILNTSWDKYLRFFLTYVSNLLKYCKRFFIGEFF